MQLPGINLGGLGGGPSAAATAPQESHTTAFFGGAQKSPGVAGSVAIVAGLAIAAAILVPAIRAAK